MPPGNDNAIQYRASGPLLAALDARTTPERAARSGVAQRDAERYYHALDEALASVELSRAEALLVCDAQSGTLTEPHTVPLLWAGVADAIRLDGLDAKWGVDGPALVERLRRLEYWQALAVVDAVERWWVGAATWADHEAGLRAVGLLREPRRALSP